MCGICGVVTPRSQEETSALVSSMTASTVHRGPDDTGQYVGMCRKNVGFAVGLGHNRLSIIDLSQAGHQPMSSEDGRYHLTYNGEIYNFREVREDLKRSGHRFVSATDSEVALRAYAEWGTECVDHLDGMFAFAIYDVEEETLFLARDRTGIKPLYYWTDGRQMAFASETKAFRRHPEIQFRPDYDVLFSFLVFLWAPEPRSAFEDVHKLPPGHTALWKDGELRIRQYWDVQVAEHRQRSYSELVEELDSLLNAAVTSHRISDVPVGCLLSGGLDSSLLAVLMAGQSSGPITTYSIGFESRDRDYEAMVDERPYARSVAESIGADHQEIVIQPEITSLLPKIVYHLDEPLGDPAAINTLLICRAARETGTKVLMSGMGADEIFGGYRKHLSVLLASLYRRAVPSFIRGRVVSPLVESLPVGSQHGGYRYFRWAKRFMKSASYADFECMLGNYAYYTGEEANEVTSSDKWPAWNTSYGVERHRDEYDPSRRLLDRMCYMDLKLFLPGLNLAYTDKSSMAASTEVRVPFLDRQVVDFAFRLPPQARIQGFTQKRILKDVARRYLPNAVIDRPKAPFGAPLRAWTRGDLDFLIERLLNKEAIARRHLLNADAVAATIEANRSGRNDYAHRIWGLITIELWFRIHVEGMDPADVYDV